MTELPRTVGVVEKNQTSGDRDGSGGGAYPVLVVRSSSEAWKLGGKLGEPSSQAAAERPLPCAGGL
eukprot:6995475-Pyramimonas_sp.AAC.1